MTKPEIGKIIVAPLAAWRENKILLNNALHVIAISPALRRLIGYATFLEIHFLKTSWFRFCPGYVYTGMKGIKT